MLGPSAAVALSQICQGGVILILTGHRDAFPSSFIQLNLQCMPRVLLGDGCRKGEICFSMLVIVAMSCSAIEWPSSNMRDSDQLDAVSYCYILLYHACR